jgi:NAD(P)-dependent dehydrogenase (short-subunit alcohol dehydrogenase family)
MANSVLISGGATGIGFAIASHLAQGGHDLVLLSRNQQRLEDAAAKLAEYGANVNIEPCDLRDVSKIEPLMRDILNKHQVGYLVNNAAANFICPTESLSIGGYRAVTDTVATGSFMLTKCCGDYWIRNKVPGRVVNISASYAQGAGPYVVPSAMAKAAIEAMTRSLAVEWGKKQIALNAIALGLFPTPGSVKQLLPNPEMVEQIRSYIPSQRFGDLQEVSRLVHFLLFECGSYLTGETIRLDGAFYHASGAGPFYNLLKDLNESFWEELRKK